MSATNLEARLVPSSRRCLRAYRGTGGMGRPAGTLALLLLASALAGSCTKDYSVRTIVNPRDPRITGLTPPTPTDLVATIGNRRVELSWSLPDSSYADTIRVYRIYRKGPADASPVLADSSRQSPFTVSNLVNGSTYLFSVSSVLDNGLEGYRSQEVSVVPATFGVQIAGGRTRVNSVNVTLAFLAPQGTAGVQISNTSDFSAAPTGPFTGSETWTLTPGDGPKTVYARFLDGEGNASTPVSAQVILDTVASIRSVTFTPASAAPGDLIRFRLDAGEAGGVAQVQLGSSGRTLALFDDATHGDSTAADGVYSLDYVAEENLDLVDAIVTGTFTDEAGNIAQSMTAAGRLTVHRSPDAVTLSAILTAGAGELFLSWSQADDPSRFASYRIYRAPTADVANDPNRRMITEISTRAVTTYTDTGLDPATTYWYAVAVVDPDGFSTLSAAQSGQPSATGAPNQPPTAVTLDAPFAIGKTSMRLSWSRNADLDFASYDLHRYLDAGLDTVVASTTRRDSTSFLDQGLLDNTSYSYRVFVKNRGGLSTGSNEQRATTVNANPDPVVLDPPADTGPDSLPTPAVRLSWSISTAHDFKEYALYRDTTPSVGEGSNLVRTISDRTQGNGNRIECLDTGLTDNTLYYYRVYVHDTAGGTAGSNLQSVITANRPPAPVTLTLSDTTSTSLSLSWTASTVQDFASYAVMQRPFGGHNAFGVADSTNQINQLNATLYFAHGDTTRYFFVVRVYDRPLQAGPRLYSESNVVTTRLNLP